MKQSEPANVDLNEFDIPLFRNLAADQLRELGSLIHRKSFPANTTLMTAEQAGEVVYLILGGTVKVHIEQADGGDVIQ
jgi:CRP/FNR family cyclic AMP-dependent transcriptional regulator